MKVLTEADEANARVARERAYNYAMGVEDGLREAGVKGADGKAVSLDTWGFAIAYANAYRDYYGGVRVFAPSLMDALALWRAEKKVV